MELIIYKCKCAGMRCMSRVPYYGRGYYTTQMKSAQQDVTTCKLPISQSVEAQVREMLQRQNVSIKGMLSTVMVQLMALPTNKWGSYACPSKHMWTIAASKEVVGEFRQACDEAGVDWKRVLSYGLFDYLKKEYHMPLPNAGTLTRVKQLT